MQQWQNRSLSQKHSFCTFKLR